MMMTKALQRLTTAKSFEPGLTVEDVTPDLAREYLLSNVKNRSLRWHAVEMYARDMQHGNWKYNGDPIRFDVTGTLIDGQHRLFAIVESGVTIRMVVLRGLDPEQQHTMDTGLRRSFSDILKLRGEKNTTALASIVRGVALWETTGSLRSTTISNMTLLDTLTRYPHLREPITLMSKASHELRLAHSAGGCLWWRFGMIDGTDNDTFWDRLTSLEDHKSGDPIFAVRRVMLGAAERRQRLTPMHQSALLIKAWNKWRRGEPMSMAIWRAGGSTPEAYPDPV